MTKHDSMTGSSARKDVPTKALKLARRVAGLPVERVAVRYTFDVILLPDGTWWLDVEKQRKMEHLGDE